MKKFFSRLAIVLLVAIVILTVTFWGRISGAWTVYNLVTDTSELLQSGTDDLRMKLEADWGADKEENTLLAWIDYQKDTHFMADFRYNDNRVVVKSRQLYTEVNLIKSSLRISSEGKDRVNFDVVRMLGEVAENHPNFEVITSLGIVEKLSLYFWPLFNCDFERTDGNLVVRFPEEPLGAGVELIYDDASKENLTLNISLENNMVHLSLDLNPASGPEEESPFVPESEIAVDREELNRAIYRGAIRAAGITLENAVRPPVDGIERTWGKGKLTYIDGNRVLIAAGTPSELGAAHGHLLKKEIGKMIDATLYTVGWVYTIEKKKWFVDEMRGAYKRLEPFIPQKYQDEMIAMAEASGYDLEEVRLTNVFPAMFHCSGFAVYNSATVDGKLYHGRVLDYMTGIGLQYHAVLFVYHPENCNAFANVGYAGFIGSVTGMNDQQVAFGEMGGRGEGDWDGMPMAFLMRDGMERATTLDEALTIFRETPRTCEYYYVISDGKIPDARGLSTSPTRFDIIEANKVYDQLPSAVENAVLMSAGDRYKKLVERVEEKHGKIDLQAAIHLMDRPVAMKSNLHTALFAPQTLELWIANAGANTPAVNEPYTRYSIPELLQLLE